MKFFPNDIVGKMDKMLFVQYVWGVSGGKIGMVKDIITDLFMGVVIVNYFGFQEYSYLVYVFAVIYVFCRMLFGLFLIKKNIMMREGGLNNRMANPQLIAMENRVLDMWKKIMFRDGWQR